MERVEIARVAVSAAPYAIDKPYRYLIPAALLDRAVPGVRVTVPFGRGNRRSEGIILARETGERPAVLKPLLEVIDAAPVLDEEAVRLALWLRQRYFCTVFDAVKAMLPAGLLYRVREVWRLNPALPPEVFDAPPADPGQLALWNSAPEDAAAEESDESEVSGTSEDSDTFAAAEPSLDDVRAALTQRHAGEIIAFLKAHNGRAETEAVRAACGEVIPLMYSLEAAGALLCETAVPRRKIQTRRSAELAVPAEEALAMAMPRRKSAPVQYAVVQFLASAGRTSCADICYYTGAETQTLARMEKRGYLRFLPEERPAPTRPAGKRDAAPIVLNAEQEAAFQRAETLMARDAPAALLLHGVTGSGKTSVYLRLVEETLRRGKTAMVLVPEIVLTPQMMRKFSARFGDAVAMLHSSLRVTERVDQWRRVQRGEARVVLGTRSAVFAPLRNLGLLVLDEEQEGSYQSENPPRYHTRDVAKYLCARNRALLVLGSATPSIETAWAAEQGRYERAMLLHRYNEQALPAVVIADLRKELRAGNGGVLGSDLRRELEANLSRGEQSILFLNRRGSSRMLLCGECGFVPECPRCSAPLTYHSANHRLMCHHCGHSEWAVERCPRCGGLIKRLGFGTQRVEEELHSVFPGAEVLRMDADTTGGGHEKLLAKFEKERIPILLGTQMVAKGLDFGNVTLVGVLLADLSLYVDSYRAAERTFNLLTQVAGRAGRGGKPGRAVVQTYTPNNDVIQSAAAQDYARFYDSEIRLRALRRNPPFADLFLLTVTGVEESAVLRGAALVRDTMRALFGLPADFRDGTKSPGGEPLRGRPPGPIRCGVEPEVLGPAPAPVVKVNNRFRYRVTLVAENSRAVREGLSWLLRAFSRDQRSRGLNLFVDCNGMD